MDEYTGWFNYAAADAAYADADKQWDKNEQLSGSFWAAAHFDWAKLNFYSVIVKI